MDKEIKPNYQFSSVTQLCLILCDPMDSSMSGFLVHHQLRELAQTYVHWLSDVIQPSHPLSSPSPALNLSQHQSLFKWVLFTSGGLSVGVSASATVLPINIQDWFPLGLTRLTSLQSKGLSKVFSSITVQKPPLHLRIMRERNMSFLFLKKFPSALYTFLFHHLSLQGRAWWGEA